MTNPSGLVSINKLYNELKSQGVSLSKSSLYEYIEVLDGCIYLVQHIEIFPFPARADPESLKILHCGYGFNFGFYTKS